MRYICLDTETTGLRHEDGHKVIELGCVEIIGFTKTGKTLHHLINPERNIDAGSFAVHGISNDAVANKPRFAEIAKEFLDFIQNSTLVIHNAAFDMGFLNKELSLIGVQPLANEVVDTLKLAKAKFPGSPASLDALCKRFKIDLSDRTKHGALIDSMLLADVFLELRGGSQDSFFSSANSSGLQEVSNQLNINKSLDGYNSLIKIIAPSESELALHDAKMPR
jgi:DNA polymerase III subunit epsilon